ncbi:MAG TPA: ribosome maturation factor RimP [Steroidobacteraceae bacterium]|nr:ribosome maturation factor RimP [Steroidobacteraceae bacterium]
MAAGLREKLIGLVEPLLGNLGYELVDLELSIGHGAGLLRVYIDRAAGVAIEDCERASREISALLDVHDPIPGAYRLEVSTPGLDRVLRTPAHFGRFAGQKAEIELAAPRDGRRRFTGRLAQVGEAGIELSVDGTTVPLAFADIFRARLVPEWPEKPGKGRKR